MPDYKAVSQPSGLPDNALELEAKYVWPGKRMIRVRGVQDMINKLGADLTHSKSGLIDLLEIVGHGQTNMISIGDDDVVDTTWNTVWGPLFKKLGPMMAKDGYIRLGGCSVGASQAIMGGMAKATNRPVQGMDSPIVAVIGVSFGNPVAAYPDGTVTKYQTLP